MNKYSSPEPSDTLPHSSPDSEAWSARDDVAHENFVRVLEMLWSQLPLQDTDPSESAPVGIITEKPGNNENGNESETICEDTFGRFAIVKHLGRGRFGAVILAKDPVLNRLVALKMPAPEALGSISSRERFLREARALAASQHPNIVAIYEAGIVNHIPYLAMEFCEHGSLADWLHQRGNRASIPCRWAARLIAAVADGVQHAHDQGILHRDLKPGNILLRPDSPSTDASWKDAEPDMPFFTALVADFGLAKMQDAAKGVCMTVSGNPIGTFPYMSPESALGDTKAISHPADVYSLGVILYELLTGQRPFPSDSPADLRTIIEDPPIPPRKLRPDIPRDLEYVCLKCLEKSPQDRYPSPKDLACDLRLFVNNQRIDRRRPPFRKRVRMRLRTFGNRPRARTKIAVLACGLAVLALAYYAWILKKHYDIELLFTQIQSAGNLAELEPHLEKLKIVARYEPQRIPRIKQLAEGEPVQKFAADWVFADTEIPSYKNCLDALLNAPAGDIPIIARLVHQVAGQTWITRLERLSKGAENPSHRANAACALLTLGVEQPPWSMFQYDRQPEARTILIHNTIPSGVDPILIADQLQKETDAGILHGLLLALGDLPGDSRPAVANIPADRIKALYETHPDAGVHSAAKWLMHRWSMTEERKKIDERLRGAAPKPGQRWRISRTGLTFIRVDLHLPEANSGNPWEISDNEIPVHLFRLFEKEYRPDTRRNASEADTLPAYSVNYFQAVAFCNWLSEREGIRRDQWLYEPSPKSPNKRLARVENAHKRSGYGLPTVNQLKLAAQGRSQSRHFLGDSPNYLADYARLDGNYESEISPAGALRPNEFGLFDIVGNLREWCDPDQPEVDGRQRPMPGFSVATPSTNVDKNASEWSATNASDARLRTCGFRIVRHPQYESQH